MIRVKLLLLGLATLLIQTPGAASSNALERIEVGEGYGPYSLRSTYVYECKDLVVELRHQRDLHSRTSQFTAVLVNGRRLKSHKMQALNAKLPSLAFVFLPAVSCMTQSVGLWITVKAGLEETESAFRFRIELSDNDLESP